MFEIVSPGSSRVDRIIKVREDAAVPSIRRSVVLASTAVGLTVFARQGSSSSGGAITLTGDETLLMPELAIEIPVAALYQEVDFGHDGPSEETPAR